MKTGWLVIGVGVVVLVIASGMAALPRAQEAQPEQKPQPTFNPADPWGVGLGVHDEIKALGWMVGTWDVEEKYTMPGAPEFVFKTDSVIEPFNGGCFLLEKITAPGPGGLKNPLVAIRSYDRFRKAFRVVWYDQLVTLADVYEGAMEHGVIAVDNIKGGTAFVMGGKEWNTRITQKPGASNDEFSLIWESSGDKGATWNQTAEYSYRRRK